MSPPVPLLGCWHGTEVPPESALLESCLSTAPWSVPRLTYKMVCQLGNCDIYTQETNSSSDWHQLSAYPFPNMRFPGKFQFLRAHYLSSLLVKKRGTRVSLEYLSSSQEPGNRRPRSPQAPVLRSSCQVSLQIINFLNLPSLSCQVAALDS